MECRPINMCVPARTHQATVCWKGIYTSFLRRRSSFLRRHTSFLRKHTLTLCFTMKLGTYSLTKIQYGESWCLHKVSGLVLGQDMICLLVVITCQAGNGRPTAVSLIQDKHNLWSNITIELVILWISLLLLQIAIITELFRLVVKPLLLLDQSFAKT